MDCQFIHPTEIYTLRPCRNPDALDLVAIGGEHSVEIIQVTHNACHRLASFHVGSRITAIAWSSKTTSPSSTDKWYFELIAASSDFGLHILTMTRKDGEFIFPFGGGLSGHHGRVNDMAFCGGWGEDSARYVATVSDDKMLMVWDLHPAVECPPSPDSIDYDMSPPASARPQPTAYVIPFPHPLASIRNHPSSSKEFVVSDCRGSVFITDWRSDPEEEVEEGGLRHSSVIELTEPSALAASCMATEKLWSSSVDWRVDSFDLIGGVYGPKYVVWDISKLHGGLPHVSGDTFPEGGRVFRWCQTHTEYFAISSHSPTRGATIHVHNYSYVQVPPSSFTLRPTPHFIRDFDFLSLKGIPRIAAAVGRTLFIFAIGEDT